MCDGAEVDVFELAAGRHAAREPGDGEYAAFQPGAGIAMGYDDLKVIEAYRFLRSIADGRPYGATLADAIRSAEALDALERSVATGAWVSV